MLENTIPIQKKKMRGSLSTISVGLKLNHTQNSAVMMTNGDHGDTAWMRESLLGGGSVVLYIMWEGEGEGERRRERGRG